MNYTPRIKKFAKKLGADVVGVADLALLKGIKTKPLDLLEGYTYAVCVGKAFHAGIMSMIVDKPIPAYSCIHRALNDHLNMINKHLVQYIREQGYKAHQIPATEAGDIAQKMNSDFFDSVDLETFDWEPLTSSSLPSKAVARAAGLGCFGKNFLIINPKLGPAFRHASLITDMPLEPDKPVDEQICGKCNICKDACPVNAIKGLKFDGIPPGREEVLNFSRCRDLLWRTHKNLPEIGYPICGVCISVCPWSKQSLKHKIGRALFGWVPPDVLTSLPEVFWK
jgi:epoxyqueuosine reductase